MIVLINVSIPKYKIRPNPNRFIINKAIIFLIAIILVYYILKLNHTTISKISIAVQILIFIGITLIILLNLIKSYLKFSNYSYEFHSTKLVINEKKHSEVKYSDIINLSYSANIIDKKMLTGTFILTLKDGSVKKIKYLKNPNQTFIYLQKIVNHTKNNIQIHSQK